MDQKSIKHQLAETGSASTDLDGIRISATEEEESVVVKAEAHADGSVVHESTYDDRAAAAEAFVKLADRLSTDEPTIYL